MGQRVRADLSEDLRRFGQRITMGDHRVHVQAAIQQGNLAGMFAHPAQGSARVGLCAGL